MIFFLPAVFYFFVSCDVELCSVIFIYFFINKYLYIGFISVMEVALILHVYFIFFYFSICFCGLTYR